MLLDTSGLFSYINIKDPSHDEAVRLLESASVCFTHNYVLAELVALCNARRINPKAALDFAEEVERSGDIEIVWIGPTEHRAGIELLTKRPDKAYSLCDAVSFVLMRRRGLTDALTTDRHFEQEGFVRLLRA